MLTNAVDDTRCFIGEEDDVAAALLDRMVDGNCCFVDTSAAFWACCCCFERVRRLIMDAYILPLPSS